MCPADAPKKEPQVEEQLKILENQAEELRANVTALGIGIASVLQPFPSEGADSHPEECLVPLAERIREIRRTVENILGTVREYQSGLEL